MFEALKALVLRLLKVPPEPPDPMGDVKMLRVFRASPNYYRYRLLGWSVSLVVGWAIFLAVAVGLILGGNAGGGAWLPAFRLLAALVGLLFAITSVYSYAKLRLDYEMRWYKVTDRSLRIREGVTTVREMTMTFANIQNIEIRQGPLQKLFGIADLQVQSAGGGSSHAEGQSGAFDAHTAYFRGVDNASEIRDLMLARLKHLRDAGLGDHEDAALALVPAAFPTSGGTIELLRELAAESRRMHEAAQAAAEAGQS